MSAGEKESEHSVFDGPSSELIFFFSLEKKLKINREHTRLFSFCHCKAHVQFKSDFVENKVTGKWSTGRGVGQQQEIQALQSGSLKWHVPPNPCNGEHPCPWPTLPSPRHSCPHTPACEALAWENTCIVFSWLDFKCHAAAPAGRLVAWEQETGLPVSLLSALPLSISSDHIWAPQMTCVSQEGAPKVVVWSPIPTLAADGSLRC